MTYLSNLLFLSLHGGHLIRMRGGRMCNLFFFIDQARLKVMKNYVNSKVSITDIAVEEFKNLCPI